MTVSTIYQPARYVGDNSTTAYPYHFEVASSSHMKVSFDGVTQGSGYTVSGVGVDTGGSVTFSVAPGTGVIVVLERNAPVSRDDKYQPNGMLPESTLESDPDYITMLVQQAMARIDRSPVLDPRYGVGPYALPYLAAGYLRWNGGGTALEAVASPIGVQVTTAGSLYVDSIADLKNLAAGVQTYVEVGGYNVKGDGGGGQYYWDAVSALADNGGTVIRPASLPATGRWLLQPHGVVSVLQFGADPTGVADSTAAFVAALAAADEVMIPDGTYILTAGTNFAAVGKALVGIGKPVLDFSAGVGVGFKLDAGGSGANMRNMRVENFTIKGGPAITDIFYSRGIITSQFSNISVREGTTTGFALKFAILNTYENCRVSNDELAMTTSPSIYWSLDTDGSAGNRCQENTFINSDVSGKGATSSSTGFKLIDATLNTFYGGTSESVKRGVDIAAGCRLNSFIGMDFEDNVDEDILDAGTGNAYINNTSNGGGLNSGTQITGDGAVFIGGSYAIISFGAASTDSSLQGVGVASGGGIQGTGTYSRHGCYTVDNAGLRNGTLGDIAVGTVLDDDARAGAVGEVMTATLAVGSAVSLTTNTTSDITTLSLTPGDWDITGVVAFTGNAATSVTQFRGSISTTTNTLGALGTKFSDFFPGGALMFTANDLEYVVPQVRISIAANTTAYLNAIANFTINTCSAYGTILARRVR